MNKELNLNISVIFRLVIPPRKTIKDILDKKCPKTIINKSFKSIVKHK